MPSSVHADFVGAAPIWHDVMNAALGIYHLPPKDFPQPDGVYFGSACRIVNSYGEIPSSFGPSYWEGAIDVNGKRGASPVHGVGYLEMTGYAQPMRY